MQIVGAREFRRVPQPFPVSHIRVVISPVSRGRSYKLHYSVLKNAITRKTEFQVHSFVVKERSARLLGHECLNERIYQIAILWCSILIVNLWIGIFHVYYRFRSISAMVNSRFTTETPNTNVTPAPAIVLNILFFCHD